MSVLKNSELTGKVRAVIFVGAGHPIEVNAYPFNGFQHTPSLVSVLRNSELTGKVITVIFVGAGHPIEVNPYPVAIKYPV